MTGAVFTATASGTAAIDPSPTHVQVGASVSQVETFTSSALGTPVLLEISAPRTQGGLTLDTRTATTLLLSGVPSRPDTYTFTVAGTDGIAWDTATLQVIVSCPSPIDVGTSTAAVCLSVKGLVALGDQGYSPADTATITTSGTSNPHSQFTTSADGCAACHRTHTDRDQSVLLVPTVSRSATCLACHNGTGATLNVQQEYTTSALSGQNNAATRSYYTHDALAVGTGHVPAQSNDDGSSFVTNEFQGVTNRHSDCVDCHNPHVSDVTPLAKQWIDTGGTSHGWVIPGAIASASVVLAQSDTSTAFVPWARSTGNGRNYEYELCIKCHSDFTVLGDNSGFQPSQYWLDKRTEIDPATPGNNSMHPIKAAGTNQSETMTASLTGTSAYKLWKFATTDTVRCTHCHASAARAEGPGQVLAPHASGVRGILTDAYRDRQLMAWSAVADTARFALCFQCHTDVPFVNNTTSGTAFQFHYEHFAVVTGSGTAGSDTVTVDTAGAGNGHALCSECHFRLHSTINKVAGQDLSAGSTDKGRLVNFAPNVEAVGGVIRWTPRNGSQPGTCTLKCHGITHNATAY